MSIAALAPALAGAARVVGRVAAGKSLADELDGGDRLTTRAALLDLTHGTLRRFGRVQAVVRQLSHRGKSDELVEPLLWCALYALESHFDVRHSFNPTTGEELNVVEENSTDRPWSLRQYMRVDWS